MMGGNAAQRASHRPNRIRLLTLGLLFGLHATTAWAGDTSPGQTPPAPRRRGASARAAKQSVPAGYVKAVRAWHTPTPGRTAPRDVNGRPILVLAHLNTRERVELAPVSDQGGFTALDLDRAATFLREPASGNQHPIEPRLLDVVYRIQARFDAQEIRVLSAYRTPRARSGSNHGRGRAVDFVVPGASNDEVARFARELGFVGVGVYPTSGFLHVDVRERSYFWVDASGPGRRNRERGVLGDVAKRSDEEAAARGERRLGPFFIASDVDLALSSIGAFSTSPARGADEEDEHEGDVSDE